MSDSQSENQNNIKEVNQKNAFLNTKSWLRLLYMVLFGFVFYVLMYVLGIVALVQAVYTIIVGSPCEKLLPFSKSLSEYVYQIVQFELFASDEKPFPFKDWPQV